MHELSIVMSIIGIAEKEAAKCGAAAIEEIEMEIGILSGIEMAAFDFAWEQAVKDTILQNAERKIVRTEGKAGCLDCDAVFTLQQLYEPCPNCGSHFIDITRGKELKVKSLVITETVN